MSLKQKTINGFFWSFIDTFFGQGIQLIITILLARILSPREFGLIGMLVILIAISQSIVNSGFSQALIRKQDCTQDDYSTVFYFNLLISSILVLALFFGAPLISNFFEEPELKPLVQVFSLVVLIDGIALIQRTKLTKNINFRLQTKISITASIISGIISITMALRGYGVWSLLAMHVSKRASISILLWLFNSWLPSLTFSRKSFRELFNFGNKILIVGLIDTLYKNIYYAVIGKYFNASELGYYTQADQYKKYASQGLTKIIQQVSFPVLSEMQNNNDRLTNNYQILIRSTMFITFCLMLGMGAIAKPLIIALIGEKWLPSVFYLQMLSLIGMFYPLHALNLNLLQVKGRSDLYLRLEIIKKILVIPVIIIGINYGIKIMLGLMLINTIIAYYLNSYYSGKFINYPFLEQIKSILPSFLLAFSMASIELILSKYPLFPGMYQLIFQLSFGVMYIVGISELIKFKEYIYLKSIILEKVKTK